MIQRMLTKPKDDQKDIHEWVL